jgi:hypothetical protein
VLDFFLFNFHVLQILFPLSSMLFAFWTCCHAFEVDPVVYARSFIARNPKLVVFFD